MKARRWLLVAALVLIGAVTAVVLVRDRRPVYIRSHTNNLSLARQMHIALFMYSTDFETRGGSDRYPATLRELILGEYLTAKQFEQIRFFDFHTGEQLDWLYFRPSDTPEVADDWIILAGSRSEYSQQQDKWFRVVFYKAGNGEYLPEEKFQELIAKQGSPGG